MRGIAMGVGEVRPVTVIVTMFLVMTALFPLLLDSGAVVLTTLSDGSSEGVVEFVSAGKDTNLSLKLPKEATVNMAKLNITGLGRQTGTAEDTDFDFNDTLKNKAWRGGADDRASGNTSDYKGSAFTVVENNAVKSSDDVRASNMGVSDQYAYHHFAFFVPMEDIVSIDVLWEGGGLSTPQMGFATGGAVVLIFNNVTGGWEELGRFNCGEIWCEQNVTSTLSVDPANYLDDERKVHILATSINGLGFNNRIDTDFVKITVSGIPTDYPVDPSLDIGDDGDVEWSLSGTFVTTIIAGGQSLVDELNEHVQAAGAGPGDVTITLSLNSSAPGRIRVWGISIDYGEHVDQVPTLKAQIPSTYVVKEDTDAPDLIELNMYFEDEEDAQLSFTVVNNSMPSGLQATIGDDGKMSFTTPTLNWNGDVHLVVRAEDSKGQSVDSNEFKVFVEPVNDPPVLEPVGDLTATEGTPFSVTLSASDVDTQLDPTEVVRYSSNNTKFKVDPVTGVLEFTPTDADVGRYFLNLSARDVKGAVDPEHVRLTIIDINNPPELSPVGDWEIFEDMYFLLQLDVSDVDTRDTHTFTSRGDLFEISFDGTIELTPAQEDVGEHTMTLTVSDGFMEDSEVVTFTVKNRNDVPIIDPIPDQIAYRGTEFVYQVVAHDEDLGNIHGERLTYMDNSDLFDIDPETGEIRFTPTVADIGVYNVSVGAEDEERDSGFFTFVLTIELVNDLPVVRIDTNNGKLSFMKGAKVTLTAVATDADGDPMTYSWTSENEPEQVLGTTEILELKAKKKGKTTYMVTVSDGFNETVQTVTIKVKVEEKGLLPGFGADMVIGSLALLAAMALLGKRGRPRKKP